MRRLRTVQIDQNDNKTAIARNRKVIFFIIFLFVAIAFIDVYKKNKVNVRMGLDRFDDAFPKIKGALERYRMDNGTYPFEASGIYPGQSLWPLTTPHSYLWEWDYLQDPFSEECLRVAFFDAQPPKWLLLSAGPDKDWDIEVLPGLENREGWSKFEDIRRLAYDPTNGTTSNGDLMRVVGE